MVIIIIAINRPAMHHAPVCTLVPFITNSIELHIDVGRTLKYFIFKTQPQKIFMVLQVVRLRADVVATEIQTGKLST